jgi:L-rhamnose isomerase
VDAAAALKKLDRIALSIHCWQGDDVGGFEATGSALSGGGLQVTGNHPGRARNVDELRMDLETALSLIPGRHRVNLHAIYGEFGGRRVDRNEIENRHFAGWVDWAAQEGVGLDFNCSCFSHPLAADGWTIASGDRRIREFWIEHIRRCRAIASWMGGKLGAHSIHNLWVPDGSKDLTAFRMKRREHLKSSLDEIFSRRHPEKTLKDSVESKLFGIGSESFVAGSHEFYLGYVSGNPRLIPCLDMGHFHPTESVADKISSLLLFSSELMIHVSRGVRWDSDHVALFGDELLELMLEVGRADAFDRVHFALDYFDASINRVGAWVIGARATLKAALYAMLEPVGKLRKLEAAGDHCGMLAVMDEMKAMPFGAVWNRWCGMHSVPPGAEWLAVVGEYEKRVLGKRG